MNLVGVVALGLLLFVAGAVEEEFDPAKLDRCTTMITGKKAGKSGPMTTHTADCLDCDFRVNKVPAADHPPGSMRNIYLFKGDYPQTITSDRGATWLPSNLEGTDEQKAAWGTQSTVIMTIPEVSNLKCTTSLASPYDYLNYMRLQIHKDETFISDF